ncbi:MAG: tyrosine--tRNA ligase [Phycisphaerales bacterium]|nr:tyrosine--tRNA ligase [Phycisphaerales bacterium]MCB9837211.1 tyrosine--tRNA ligase [Phycisphaera sp.]
MDLLEELQWRGMLHQGTDLEGLRAHLADPSSSARRIYAGFDPTADSLTIGNLVPIMLLKHVQRAGHTPIVVMGGGTGLIGDPSGKSAERQLMTAETVAHNIACQRPIFSNILGDDVTILNNADWLANLGYLEALRDIGKFFSVNMMIQKDSVRSRLQDRDHGISYTEFSYMILQAYDFAYLYEKRGVTVQCGGSDQYGNIVTGTDLIRRMVAVDIGVNAYANTSGPDQELLDEARKISSGDTKVSFGFTAPLVTKADGTKFGKTESGAVWLTAVRTSPYAYYQFWLNTSDADVSRFLRTFTLLDRAEIERLDSEVANNPGAREAQKKLAYEATKLLHGEAEAESAVQASQALFSGDISSLPEETLRQVLADVPSTERSRSEIESGVDLVELLVELGLASSKRQSREFIQAGSVSINGLKIGPDARLTGQNLIHGKMIAIRRGKKNWHLTIWK